MMECSFLSSLFHLFSFFFFFTVCREGCVGRLVGCVYGYSMMSPLLCSVMLPLPPHRLVLLLMPPPLDTLASSLTTLFHSYIYIYTYTHREIKFVNVLYGHDHNTNKRDWCVCVCVCAVLTFVHKACPSC